MNTPTKPIEQLVKEDGRYSIEAVHFVRQGLSNAVEKLYPNPDPATVHHISGPQLCESLREVALQRWGGLARLVLLHWNIKKTRDFGEIVFLLVNNGWMQKQPTDNLEDFDSVYDFATAFKDPFELDAAAE